MSNNENLSDLLERYMAGETMTDSQLVSMYQQLKSVENALSGTGRYFHIPRSFVSQKISALRDVLFARGIQCPEG